MMDYNLRQILTRAREDIYFGSLILHEGGMEYSQGTGYKPNVMVKRKRVQLAATIA